MQVNNIKNKEGKMEELKRKSINKNTKVAWQLEMNKIETEISMKRRREDNILQRNKKGLDKDAFNRNYITEKIVKHIMEGMEKEEAIEKVMEEEKEVVESFEYLEKVGLDLKVVFSNWASDKNIKKKMHEMENNKGEER